MCSSDRRLFHVAPGPHLPPLPGQAAVRRKEALAVLLEDLLTAAECDILPSPESTPDIPSVADLFDALTRASAAFEVAPGFTLADHFWIHAAPLGRGDVATALRATARAGANVQGFLAIYAVDVRPPLLYNPGMAPLRVQDTTAIASDIDGPFLALIACELMADGSAQAKQAYAMPIYHARRFMPVRSNLDRDVLRALEHLQVALDAHGVECTIKRVRDEADANISRFSIISPDLPELLRRVDVVVDATGQSEPVHDLAGGPVFQVTSESWANGAFTAWLERIFAPDHEEPD